jgi:hypothetical protein
MEWLCVTGCKIQEVLHASHIKPWKDCSNKELLDEDNGLLPVANLDALLYKGLVSFAPNGSLIRSVSISEADYEMLIGHKSAELSLNSRQASYMKFHLELHGS